jgi:hypothetical protein
MAALFMKHGVTHHTRRDKGESYFVGYYRNGSSQWFRKIKMNLLAFMSINRRPLQS